MLDEEDPADAAGCAPQVEPLLISGFTPINQAGYAFAGEQDPQPRHVLSEVELEGKVRATKKRTVQEVAGLPAAKLRKGAGLGRTKGSKKANELQCQDILKGLPKTKPTSRKRAPKPVKTVSPTEITLLEQRPDTELLQDALLSFEIQGNQSLTSQSRALGLSDNYQVACIKTGMAGADAATHWEYDLSDPVFENIVGGSSFSSEMHHRHELCTLDPDSEPPPSAQGDFMRGPSQSPVEARLDLSKHTKATPEMCLDDNDVYSDFVDDLDLPMDDECHEGSMQSLAPFSAFNEQEDGLQQDCFDDYMVIDDFLTEDKDICEEIHSSLTGTFPRTECVVDHGGISTRWGKDFSKSTPWLYAESQSPCVSMDVSGTVCKPKQIPSQILEGSENSFDDDDLDEDLVDLAIEGSDLIKQQPTASTSPTKPSTPKLQWLPPKFYIPAKPSPAPASPTDVIHRVSFDENRKPLPFMRPPFPAPIRDRSPVLGLTNRTVLRTCFRIGEALNAAAVASRANSDAIIELYARVISSEREASGAFKQHFLLGDLFTKKPPHLNATYNLWKGVELWDDDSKVFLGEKGSGKMARVMGRIKKGEKGIGVLMVMLSVWEVDWEDVGIAKGIVCS